MSTVFRGFSFLTDNFEPLPLDLLDIYPTILLLQRSQILIVLDSGDILTFRIEVPSIFKIRIFSQLGRCNRWLWRIGLTQPLFWYQSRMIWQTELINSLVFFDNFGKSCYSSLYSFYASEAVFDICFKRYLGVIFCCEIR